MGALLEPELVTLYAGCPLGVRGDTPSLPHPLSQTGCWQCLCFPSRESKELADLARLHPTSCAANGLNPNLMVTGGPSLAGSGRWSADPAAHLATHPWLPRSGSTSMWLAGHPYGKCGVGDVPFLWWLRTEWAQCISCLEHRTGGWTVGGGESLAGPMPRAGSCLPLARAWASLPLPTL